MNLSLSLSIAFPRLGLLDRPAAAAALGYVSVESWWPWAEVAGQADIRAFAGALEASGSSLLLLNVTEGDASFGGRGLAGVPSAGNAFWHNCDSVLAAVELTGARFINVLAGNRSGDSALARSTLIGRLARFAARADALGATVLVEQLNPDDHPQYLLTDPWIALDVVRATRELAGRRNIAMLADLYHLGRAGHDPVAFVRDNARYIGHVQVADAPGRGRPGTGTLPIIAAIDALYEAGYRGGVGLEYSPGDEPIPSPGEMLRQLSSA